MENDRSGRNWIQDGVYDMKEFEQYVESGLTIMSFIRQQRWSMQPRQVRNMASKGL